jgi:hypothetical protein
MPASRDRCRVGRLLAGIVAAGVLLPGCDSDGPPLGGVTGTVMLDGTPVENAFVVFTPDGPGRPSSTKTDAAGRFMLRFNQGRAGALVGTHRVTVSTASITDDDRVIPERIPAKYNKRGSIAVTVNAGQNDIRLDLTSD